MTEGTPTSLNAARAERDQDARQQRADARTELEKKLRLRCMELALESQKQNPGEVLSTEALSSRAVAIYTFVLGSRGPTAA